MDVKNQIKQNKINILRGKNPAAINIQSDGCYNNALYSGVGRTPFQPSTQAIYLFAENETDRNQIINLQTISKLCSKRRNGFNIECHHVGKCFANIAMATSIGNEEQWAKQGLLDLSGAGLEAEFITTDPDSSAYRAAMTLYDQGITSIEPSHLLDTRHITQNHRKFIKNMTELTAHMPGRTKIERQKTQNKFAIDLAARCQAEFNQAFRKFRKNVPKLKSVLSYTCDSVVECYHGNHALCNTYSFVCMAKTNTTWLQRSHYLHADFTVKPGGDSLVMLRKCVEYRLGQGMLEKTRLNTNTQKCEATNRSFRRSLPKYLTFARNFSGRSHSAVHNINNGPGESVFKLCKAAGSTIHGGTRVCQALKQQQKISHSNRKRKRTQAYKDALCRKRRALYRLYEKNQEEINYRKNMMLVPIHNKNATVTIHTQELMVQKQNRLNVNMISLIWIRMYYSKFYHAFKTNRMAHVMRCTVPDSCKGFVPYSSRGSLNKGGLCSHIGYCDINGTLPVFFLDKSPPSKPCAQSCMQLGVLFLCIYCRRAK